jgi:HSP20 family protein
MARNVLRFDPLAELEALQRRFFGDVVTGAARGGSVPTTDVYTEGDRFVIEAHLPNFTEKDVEISLDDEAVTIQGQRQDREEDTRKRRYVVRETSQNFYRRVPLPERADESRISASYENGMLKIVIPFKDQPAAKRIPITLGSSASADTSDASGSDAAPTSEGPAPTA